MANFVLPTMLGELELNTLVNGVVTAHRDLQGSMQQAILQTVLAAHSLSGNLNPLTNLLNGLLLHGKRKQFKNVEAYIKDHTPIKFKQAKDINGKDAVLANGQPRLVCKLKSKSVASDWLLEEMCATTYLEYARPKKDIEKGEFSFSNQLAKIVKSIDKQLAEAIDPAKADNLRMQRNLAKQAAAAIGLAV